MVEGLGTFVPRDAAVLICHEDAEGARDRLPELGLGSRGYGYAIEAHTQGHRLPELGLGLG